MRDGFIPDYAVIEKLNKEELINLVYRMDGLLTESLEQNGDYSNIVWHLDNIYRLKEKILIRDRSIENALKYFDENTEELEAKYKEKPDDSKEEHNG